MSIVNDLHNITAFCVTYFKMFPSLLSFIDKNWNFHWKTSEKLLGSVQEISILYNDLTLTDWCLEFTTETTDDQLLSQVYTVTTHTQMNKRHRVCVIGIQDVTDVSDMSDDTDNCHTAVRQHRQLSGGPYNCHVTPDTDM